MFDIQAISNTYRRPIFAAQVLLGQGALSAQSQSLRCLVIGQYNQSAPTGYATITQEQAPQLCTSADQADILGGPGSPLALMARAALLSGAEVWVAAPTFFAEVAATAALAMTGTATAAGWITITTGSTSVQVNIANGDSATTVAATIASIFGAAANNLAPYPVSAVVVGTTVNFTAKCHGAPARNIMVAVDTNNLPTGFSVFTLTGLSTVTTTVNGVLRAWLGSATAPGSATFSTYTNLITNMGTARYARIAIEAVCCQSNSVGTLAFDSAFTNTTGAWAIYLAQQNDPTVLQPTQIIVASNVGTSNVTTPISNSTFATTLVPAGAQSINNPLISFLHFKDSPTPGFILAASMAGKRAALESVTPLVDYDIGGVNSTLPAVLPQLFPASDAFSAISENYLLLNGLTPVRSEGTVAKITRAVVTYTSFTSGASVIFDDRVADVGDVTVAQFIALDLQFYYQFTFRAKNPIVAPDPDPRSPPPPAGVAYPLLWSAAVENRMRQFYVKNGWIRDLDATGTGVQSSFNAIAQRIQSSVTFIVNRLQHQMLVTVRQIGPNATP